MAQAFPKFSILNKNGFLKFLPANQEDPFRPSVRPYQADLDIRRRPSLQAIQVTQDYLDIQHHPFGQGSQADRVHLNNQFNVFIK